MRDLTIRIEADGSQAKRELGAVDQSVNKLTDSTKAADAATSQWQTSMGKFVQAVGGLKAIEEGTRRLVDFAKESVGAMADQEAATVKLTTALKAQATFTPAVITQYEQLAEQFQKTTVFSDDLIEQMEALLVQVGNVMPGDMKKALTAATDLSAGLGVDLRQATMLVGKAFEGETGTLKRYGIVIDDAALKADRTGAVLDAIHAKFGGQAQAQIETYTGKVANLSNRWNDFQERVGAVIIRGLTPLLNLFEMMPETLQTVTFAVGALTATLGPLVAGAQLVLSAFGTSLVGAFSALAGFVTSTVVPLFATVLPLALRGLAALLTPPVGLVIAGILAVVAVWKNWDTIGPIVQNVYNAVKEWMVDKFGQLVKWIGDKVNEVTGFFKSMYDKVVGNSYVPDMIYGIEREFGRLPEVMVQPTTDAISGVTGSFQNMATGVQSGLMGRVMGVLGDFGASFRGVFSDLNQVFVDLFTGGHVGKSLRRFEETVVGGLLNLIPGIGPFLSQFAGAFTELMNKIGTAVWDGLKKIGGFFKDLFGGPSAKELAGREVVQNFEQNIASMLDERQKVEADGEQWKMTIIGIRDQYIEMGRTEADALADVKRLWDSAKSGPDAVRQLIDEITAKMHTAIPSAASDASNAIGSLNPITDSARRALDAINAIPRSVSTTITQTTVNIHEDVFRERREEAALGGFVTAAGIQHLARGGTVLPFMPRGTDIVPAMLTPGEGVVNTRGMRKLGTEGLRRLNTGQDVGGVSVVANVVVNGGALGMSEREFGEAVNRAVVKGMRGKGIRFANR